MKRLLCYVRRHNWRTLSTKSEIYYSTGLHAGLPWVVFVHAQHCRRCFRARDLIVPIRTATPRGGWE